MRRFRQPPAHVSAVERFLLKKEIDGQSANQ